MPTANCQPNCQPQLSTPTVSPTVSQRKRKRDGADEQDCKPGSVLDGHLSMAARLRVAQATSSGRGRLPLASLHGVAPGGVYRTGELPGRQWALTPLFHPCRAGPPRKRAAWRYISVALSLESPPPGTARRPAVWSPDFPHAAPLGASHAAVCPAHCPRPL